MRNVGQKLDRLRLLCQVHFLMRTISDFASFIADFYSFSENQLLLIEKDYSEARQLIRSCLIFYQNLRLKAKQPSCL